jgi:hypothetical protein
MTMIGIYNTAGQKVLTAPYSKSVNIAALSTGAYILEVTDGKISEKLKLIRK